MSRSTLLYLLLALLVIVGVGYAYVSNNGNDANTSPEVAETVVPAFDLDAIDFAELVKPIKYIDGSAELSPNNRFVVFDATRNVGTAVYVYDTETEHVHQVTGIRGSMKTGDWLSNGFLMVSGQDTENCPVDGCERYDFLSRSTDKPWILADPWFANRQ